MKKLLLTMAAVVLLVTVLLLVGCGNDTETQGGTEPDVTTPAQTTATVTTEKLTVNGIPVKKLKEVSALVGEKDFKGEALALMKLVIRDYYDKTENHVLDANGNTITLWAVGSFLEAVGSVHKMFPDDEEITTVYKGLLNYGLKDYKVRYSSKRVNGVIPYYYNAGAGGTNDYYYDDDEWIALQYLEAYKSFGDKAYLQAAQEILEFIWLGWGLQSDENIGNGGIPWHCKGEGPTTCSNAPAAYAFAIFSTLTSDEKLASDYLERAETVYKWTRTYLYKNGLYRDGYNINKDSFSDWSGSYNNGVMLAVGSLLYTLTGEKSYYRDAQITARNAYTNNTKLEGGRPEFENDTENPWMNAWLVKGYIEFYKVDSTNTVGYLNRFIDIMAFALDNQLESGYLRVQLDELPTKTWTEERDKVKVTLTNDHASTDPTHLGGGISLIIVLAEWAMLYGSNYQ